MIKYLSPLLLLLTGCASFQSGYRLILVEKERKLYNLKTGEQCEVSGYEIDPKEYGKDHKVGEAELKLTYSNCDVKQGIILNDKEKVMWGMPVEEPKKKVNQ